jgi:glyoxylase-like metal-dependent hydrolase (beta-lactamase superfamily II)
MSSEASFQVEVIKVGQCLVPGPEVYWMSHWQTMEQLYFYIVLIRNNDYTILINTGPPSDLSVLNDKWEEAIGPSGKMVRSKNEEIPNILRSRGITPTDIDIVLITPLQAYATANIALFKNAQICISQRGWIEDYHAPKFPLHVDPDLRIPRAALEYLLFDGRDKLRLIQDQEEIVPGITAHWVGTHHRSSMAYCISTRKGKVIISDAFFTYSNLEAMHPLGIMESMEECYTAYSWVNRVADIAVPLYDPQVLTRYKNGKIT